MTLVAVLCLSNPDRDPRPSRMITFFKECDLLIIGGGEENSEKRLSIANNFYKKIFLKIFQFFFPHLASIYLLSFFRDILAKINGQKYDIVLCHDLYLLPLALNIKKKTGICVFDAREYYPAEVDNSLLWRLLYKRFNIALCKKYLKITDKIITVSPGISFLYKKNFGVDSDVFYSFPKRVKNILVAPVDLKKINLVYHGAANEDRKIELLIESMQFLDKKFHLNLILVPGSQKYIDYLIMLSKQKNLDDRISFLNPVKMEDIPKFLNNFDIGVCFYPPSNMNVQYCMPNKLFEYVQARLMVVSSPLPDVMEFVKKYNVGEISEDYEINSFVNLINSLDIKKIESYKNNSNNVSCLLSYEGQVDSLKNILKGYL